MKKRRLCVLLAGLIATSLISSCGLDFGGNPNYKYHIYDSDDDEHDGIEDDEEEFDGEEEWVNPFPPLDVEADTEDMSELDPVPAPQEIDRWGFLNAGLDSKINVNGYWLSQEDFYRLVNNLSKTDISTLYQISGDKMIWWPNVDNHMDNYREWGGSCHGMSVTDILVNRGVLTPEAVHAADSLEKTSVDKDPVSAINFYMVQQNLSLSNLEENKVMAMDNYRQLELLEQLGRENKPFLISYTWYENNIDDKLNTVIEPHGHSVVGYSFQWAKLTYEGVKYDRKIEIYDCSEYPDNEGQYDLYFNDNGQWCIPGRKLCSNSNTITLNKWNVVMSNDNAMFGNIQYKIGCLNIVDYRTGETSDAYKENKDHQKTSVETRSDASFTIQCGGNIVSVDNGILDENAFGHGYTISVPSDAAETSAGRITINIPDNQKEYIFDVKDPIDLTFCGGNSRITVNASSPGTVSFDAEKNKIDISCTTSPDLCTVQMVSNDDTAFGVEGCDAVEITNHGSKDISVIQANDGMEIKGTDLSGVSVSGAIEGETAAVESTADLDTIKVGASEDDIVLYGDTDSDGNVDQVIDQTPIPESNEKLTIQDKTVVYTGEDQSIDDAVVEGNVDHIAYLYFTDKDCTKEAVSHADAGTYYVQAFGLKNDYVIRSNVATLTVQKTDPGIKLAKEKVKFKEKSLKKKKRSVMLESAGMSGELTFKKTGGSKNISVSRDGKLTAKKGLKKGKYKINLRVTSADSVNFNSGEAAIKLTVIVK